jgi:hypothetical protein
MKLLEKASDGGKDSGVTGYFLVEIKSLFSIVLLKFNKGTRDAYHNHAFNAVTLWLKGEVIEHHKSGFEEYFTGGMFKYTSRKTFHKVEALDTTWALSIRGPWLDKWNEFKDGKLITLTHGRQII